MILLYFQGHIQNKKKPTKQTPHNLTKNTTGEEWTPLSQGFHSIVEAGGGEAGAAGGESLGKGGESHQWTSLG